MTLGGLRKVSRPAHRSRDCPDRTFRLESTTRCSLRGIARATTGEGQGENLTGGTLIEVSGRTMRFASAGQAPRATNGPPSVPPPRFDEIGPGAVEVTFSTERQERGGHGGFWAEWVQTQWNVADWAGRWKIRLPDRDK
jgi:hypothetical protein